MFCGSEVKFYLLSEDIAGLLCWGREKKLHCNSILLHEFYQLLLSRCAMLFPQENSRSKTLGSNFQQSLSKIMISISKERKFVSLHCETSSVFFCCPQKKERNFVRSVRHDPNWIEESVKLSLNERTRDSDPKVKVLRCHRHALRGRGDIREGMQARIQDFGHGGRAEFWP